MSYDIEKPDRAPRVSTREIPRAEHIQVVIELGALDLTSDPESTFTMEELLEAARSFCEDGEFSEEELRGGLAQAAFDYLGQTADGRWFLK